MICKKSTITGLWQRFTNNVMYTGFPYRACSYSADVRFLCCYVYVVMFWYAFSRCLWGLCKITYFFTMHGWIKNTGIAE